MLSFSHFMCVVIGGAIGVVAMAFLQAGGE